MRTGLKHLVGASVVDLVEYAGTIEPSAAVVDLTSGSIGFFLARQKFPTCEMTMFH